MRKKVKKVFIIHTPYYSTTIRAYTIEAALTKFKQKSSGEFIIDIELYGENL